MYKHLLSFSGIFSALILFTALSTVNPGTVRAQESGSEAPVQIVEYSDYQCPACAYFHPIIEKLKEEMGDRIEVTYKFFPLNNHQYGALTARAAQAAKNQGKFLEMHNKLFEEQARWSASSNPIPIIINYAHELELDLDQFREDLNSRETQQAVMEEKKTGQEQGVNATPTFFINGEKLAQNPPNYEAFRAVVESYLSENQQQGQ